MRDDAARLDPALSRVAARIVVFDAPLPFFVDLTLYTALLTLIILIMLMSLDSSSLPATSPNQSVYLAASSRIFGAKEGEGPSISAASASKVRSALSTAGSMRRWNFFVHRDEVCADRGHPSFMTCACVRAEEAIADVEDPCDSVGGLCSNREGGRRGRPRLRRKGHGGGR